MQRFLRREPRAVSACALEPEPAASRASALPRGRVSRGPGGACRRDAAWQPSRRAVAAEERPAEARPAEGQEPGRPGLAEEEVAEEEVAAAVRAAAAGAEEAAGAVSAWGQARE